MSHLLEGFAEAVIEPDEAAQPAWHVASEDQVSNKD